MTTLGPAKSWRLIHEGTTVLALAELSGYTNTIQSTFEASTLTECLAEVSRIGLVLGDEFAELVDPAAEQREVAKATRQAAVDAITVTTTAGNTFDGDETSQTRMARAILVLSTGFATHVPWVLADNTVIQADIAELTEALALAGQAQAALWVIA